MMSLGVLFFCLLFSFLFFWLERVIWLDSEAFIGLIKILNFKANIDALGE